MPVRSLHKLDLWIDPKFFEVIELPRKLLEPSYTKANTRTKKAIANVRLADLGWSDVHHNYFIWME